jgi:molybdopterin-guanine dinucleotide biosynthesis protein A
MTGFDAVILAGGRARRLGGIDKPALEVGGTSLLGRALAAVVGAERVVVVGPRRDLPDDVVEVREEPPGGGPVAALAAALPWMSAPIVVVLGADLPAVDEKAVGGLIAALDAVDADGAVAVDESGRDQYLCAAYRASGFRARLEEIDEPRGASMRSLVGGMALERLPLGAKASDIDTPDDLSSW